MVFNSRASAAAASSSPHKALQLYSMMHRHSLPFDTFSILFALKSCTNAPLTVTRHLHAHILKLGFSAHVYVATSLLSVYSSTAFGDACILFDEMPQRTTVTWNIMVTGYSRQGDVNNARSVFDTIPRRSLASWSAIIAAYMDKSLWSHGLALFREMLLPSRRNINADCLKPDQLTLGPVLAACGRMGSVGSMLGKSIHGFAIKNKWEFNVELGTCLLDMYAKCGLVKDALLVFDTMKCCSVATWTALICGAAQHGYGREALQMFEKMREANVEPNELTFTGILAACVQAGLVEEGRRCFAMLDEYGVRPTIQHYGCMVDLLGKAGLLDEAYEVMESMPLEANVVVWGSFLSSCKLHRRLEMAEKVIEKVVRTVRPENNGGVYTLISDLYALSGNWSEAERIREMMLTQNVRKVRASSFIRGPIASPNHTTLH